MTGMGVESEYGFHTRFLICEEILFEQEGVLAIAGTVETL